MNTHRLKSWAFLAALLAGTTLARTKTGRGSSGPLPRAELISALVLSCHDGDTCTARQDNTGTELKVRLIAIDTPEVTFRGKKGQPKGEQAAQFTRSNLAHKHVDILSFGQDRYGRTLGLFFEPNAGSKDVSVLLSKKELLAKSFNFEIARQGWAWAYPKTEPEFLREIAMDAEKVARIKKVGLWAPGVNAQEPWTFRKSGRP